MLLLLITALLSAALPAAAQDPLQLPDVTLFGEYTLYLAAPEPLELPVPQATPPAAGRVHYPHVLFRVDLARPNPPPTGWPAIPRSRIAPGITGADSDGASEPGAGLDRGVAIAGGPPQSWQARIDYIPGDSVQSQFSAIRSPGIWDLSTELNVDLADGWLRSPPIAPTDLTVALRGERRAASLDIDARVRAAAFYDADPAGSTSAVFTLDASADLSGDAGWLRWAGVSRGFVMSGLDPGTPPPAGDEQRLVLDQSIRLDLAATSVEISLLASGVLDGGSPLSRQERHGTTGLELGYRNAASGLHLRAGACALYYDGNLTLYPTGGLEVYPTDSLILSLHAAPLLGLPREGNFLSLCAVQELQSASPPPQLQVEGGYGLRAGLRYDPTVNLGAVVGFGWENAQIYAIDTADLNLVFVDTSRVSLDGQVMWQLRRARPSMRLNLSAQVVFPLQEPLAANPPEWRGGLVWSTAFHKIPLEIIIKTLAGVLADDGSTPFLFSDWRITRAATSSVEVNWSIGANGTLHTGLETTIVPEPGFRLLVGYGIRR